MPVHTRVFVVAVLWGFFAPHARAFEAYGASVPNPLSPPGSPLVCITCHSHPNGGLGCDTAANPKCQNPFGRDFAANNFQWNKVLADLDSDKDGFTNGQELQDPLGEWVALTSPAKVGNTACVATPGFAAPSDLPADVVLTTAPAQDADDDGYCCSGRDLDDSGSCTDPAEHTGTNAAIGDCNDQLKLASPGAPETCTDTIDNDCDGIKSPVDSDCRAFVDNDGDGYCEVGPESNDADAYCLTAAEQTGPIDCNDENANAFSGAIEVCDDVQDEKDVDNDCDGKANLADIDCTKTEARSDQDGDGYCPAGRDLSVPADGDCLDPGESATPYDCRDDNLAVKPGAPEQCADDLDNDCDGRLDLEDTDCRAFVDLDGDGYCPGGRDLSPAKDGDCVDMGEAGPMAATDCSDGDASIFPGSIEICVDGKDRDCDGLLGLADADCAGFLDVDTDGFCLRGWDLNGDRNCLGTGEQSGRRDCNDASSSVKPGTLEVCVDGADNDCDGYTDTADLAECADLVDQDQDGFCAGGYDANRDGDCSDAGEQEPPVDCEPLDARSSPVNPEACFDTVDNNCDGRTDLEDAQCDLEGVGRLDADGDGYCPIGVDLDRDGNCAGPGEAVKYLSDCDDRNAAIHVEAEEVCRDNRDNDCDYLLDLSDKRATASEPAESSCSRVLDVDRDGFCPMGRDLNGNGNCLDSGEMTLASDCNDDNATAKPGFAENCEDGLDNDCDGAPDVMDSECPCASDAQCDDGEPCTTDRCGQDGYGCVHEAIEACDGDAGVAPTGPARDGADPVDESNKQSSSSCGCFVPGVGRPLWWSSWGAWLALWLLLGRRLQRSRGGQE